MKNLLTAIVMSLVLLGCSSMKPENFQANIPVLDLFSYFDGKTKAWGIFEDRFGNVRRQFEVDIDGKVKDGNLTLDEKFTYMDGETDQRIWRISQISKNQYEGRADDVVGLARGVVFGNALNWKYDLNLKVGGSTYVVHFDDWMFLQTGGVMINRAKVSKWGLEIGQVTLFFTKP
jgi:hypothetical protein